MEKTPDTARVRKRVQVLLGMRRQFQVAFERAPELLSCLPDPCEIKTKREWELQCYALRKQLRAAQETQ